jgi:HKD family nuclease
MSNLNEEELLNLYKNRVIDNRQVTMKQALCEFLPKATSFEMAVGYFYVSGFELVQEAFQHLMLKNDAMIRILIGNQTNYETVEVFKAGLTPQQALIEDVVLLGKEEEHIPTLHAIANWMREGRLQIKVYTGESNYFHAKSYLFGEDYRALKGSAIVGSSNFSVSGLIGNTELNSLSQDNYFALRNWFDNIWSSDEVTDFAPELMKVVDEQLPKKLIVKNYYPGLASYLDFARIYAKPPLEVIDWPELYPHQRVGVAECANRLRQFGTALLCDGVGLGKTRTAAGVIRHLATNKVLILASTKLHDQWESELLTVGLKPKEITFMSKEKVATMNAEELRKLSIYELIVIDEAHQGIKNSGTKIYRNLQYIMKHASQPISGLLLTATPWNNNRKDIFNLGRLFLQPEKVPAGRPYAEYLRFAARKASKAFEFDDDAFAALWEDLFLQRTRKTYGGKDVVFARRHFPAVKIIYEPKKQQAFEDNFERIESLRFSYMNPLRYVDDVDDQFASDRLKLLFLKRADSSWVSFESTLESIHQKLIKLVNDLNYVESDDTEVRGRFRQWISNSYKIDTRFDDMLSMYAPDLIEDLTDFEIGSRENRMRYVRKMEERISSIDKRSAKKAIKNLIRDAQADLKVLDTIRNDLKAAFDRKDEKYEAVRNQIVQAVERGEKVLLISQFRDTTLHYFNQFVQDEKLGNYRIGHVTGKSEDCYTGIDKQLMAKEEILSRFSPRSKNAMHFVGDNEIDIVIGTETLSVGQNLQDCRILMNLDLPFNPMNLEQRIGRIDRPRSDGQVSKIDIYSFPSMPVIEAELKMTERLRIKLEGIFKDTRFDDLILPEYEEYLRRVLTERKNEGEAMAEMIDKTVDKQTVPLNSLSHSAEYIQAQARMWQFVTNYPKVSLPKNALLSETSVQECDTPSVAVIKTILRDANGQDIDSIISPVIVGEWDEDLVRIEKIWCEAINNSANNTLEVPEHDAKSAMQSNSRLLAEWTLRMALRHNARFEGKKDVEGHLIEKKAKVVAASIQKEVKGPNKHYILQKVKEIGADPKVLKSLAEAIQYVDSRDSEYEDVLDLYEDISRLWNNLVYYLDRFTTESSSNTIESGEQSFSKISARLADHSTSESIWISGHIAVLKK